MQLFYFKDPLGNFGDDLNPWLWNQLIPKVIDNNPDEVFVGVGTLINHRLPSDPVKHIFGSGFGYGYLPTIDQKFNFHAVRGHHTARMLGLPAEKVITDSAVLVSTLFDVKKNEKKWRFGFMPTGKTIETFDWRKICEDMGINYISCHLPVIDALREISYCDVMLCEAMHAAIVADSLNIPWIAVRCQGDILEFKWSDWLSSVDMTYKPNDIPEVFGKRNLSLAAETKNVVKQMMFNSGMWSDRWSRPLPSTSSQRDIDYAAQKLEKIMSADPQLSSDKIKCLHVERYLSLIDRINMTYGS